MQAELVELGDMLLGPESPSILRPRAGLLTLPPGGI